MEKSKIAYLVFVNYQFYKCFAKSREAKDFIHTKRIIENDNLNIYKIVPGFVCWDIDKVSKRLNNSYKDK